MIFRQQLMKMVLAWPYALLRRKLARPFSVFADEATFLERA